MCGADGFGRAAGGHMVSDPGDPACAWELGVGSKCSARGGSRRQEHTRSEPFGLNPRLSDGDGKEHGCL